MINQTEVKLDAAVFKAYKDEHHNLSGVGAFRRPVVPADCSVISDSEDKTFDIDDEEEQERNSIEDAKDALEDEQSESEEGNVFDYGPSDDESSGVEGGR